MKTLPLYQSRPVAAVVTTQPQALNPHCIQCTFRSVDVKVRHVCMAPEGDPGGVLFIGDFPLRVEDDGGRPFTGPGGKYLRREAMKHWKGPMAFDNALKCAPGKVKLKTKMFDNCRPYLAQVLHDVNPERIVVLGNQAAYGLLGRSVSMMSVRRGYGWVDHNGKDIPVFFVSSPSNSLRNRFQARAFESDLKYALTTPTPKPKHFKYVTYVIETLADAMQATRALENAEVIVYDCETSGRMGNSDFHIECITLLDDAMDYAWTFDRAVLGDQRIAELVAKTLRSKPVVGANLKYDDGSALREWAVDVSNTEGDTRLFRKLLDFETDASLDTMAELVGEGGHKLEMQERLAEICTELKYHADPPSGLTPTGKVRKVRERKMVLDDDDLKRINGGLEPMTYAFKYVEPELRQRYNARDVFSTRDVHVYVRPQLAKHEGLMRVWDEVVKPANRAIKWIEYWGFGVDTKALHNFVTHCTAKETQALVKLHQHAPGLNPASPKQLQEYLYGKLKLTPGRATDGGQYSTDNSELERLKDEHPSIPHLIDFRTFNKLNGTYGKGMLAHVRDDRRIHSTYLLDGAGTGRLSSQDPNQQNAPRAKGSVEGKMYRDCYVAPKGFVLIEADQSQVELRVAAMLSQDPVMIEDYRQGIDIHANNARECCEIVWGIKREKWDTMTKDERDPYRSQIKTTTFGVLYGKTAAGLAHEFGTTVKVVEKIIAKIFGRYKKLAEFVKRCVHESSQTGETWTWWNGGRARRRHIWQIADQDDGRRMHAERTAYNTPVQGTAADFTTASLWPICSWILDEGVPAKLVGTIHDSILVEAHKSVVSETVDVMNKVMTGWNAQGVPLVAEFKIGERWGSMEDHKIAA